MECLQPIPVLATSYRVKHWKQGGVDEQDVDIQVFPDDSVIDVLTQITYKLGKESLPYAWHKKPMLFTPSGSWKGYHVNPFKADATSIPGEEPSLSFHLTDLVSSPLLNITFKDDLPQELQHSYYFPDLKLKLRSAKALKKEYDLLVSTWKENPQELEKIQVSQCIYTHIEYRGKIAIRETLAEIFDAVQAREKLPFVQWIDDRTRVLYKVYDQHKIPATTLQQWMQHDRIPLTDGAINLYSPFRKNFAQCVINANGNVLLRYHVDARDKIDMQTIHEHFAKFVPYLESILKIKLFVTLHEVAVRTEFSKNDTSLNFLANQMTRLLPVFHIVNFTQNAIEAIYKRSSNHTTTDITQYIRSLIKFGNVNTDEILQNLVNTYGYSISEAKSYIEQAQETEDVATSKLIETGMVVRIAPFALGYRIAIDNAPSLHEARCALHWVRSCLLQRKEDVATKQKPVVVKMVAPKPKTPSPSPSSSKESSSTRSLSIGGAVGKFEEYFVKMLRSADEAIFGDRKVNYARSCMATNFRQPVVLSKAEKEALDNTEYGKGIDNFIEYGSDPNNKNVYFCPRIWCPESKVPLTPEQYEANKAKGQICPKKGENPIEAYEHSYWDENPKVIHHIGFLGKRNSQGFCMPCCMRSVQTNKEKTKLCLSSDASNPSARPEAADLSSATVREEYYLKTQAAPLPKGRYGTVPIPLHNALFPDISHAMCSKVLTSQECLVRKGIDHGNDSFTNALASALGMKDKHEWYKWLVRKLDPMTFIGLENGQLLTLFAPTEPVIPSHNKSMCKRWKTWVSKYPKYVSIMNLQDLITKDDLTHQQTIQLSRELGVFDAYERFLAYIRSAETKNPYLFHDILRSFDVLMLLWEKQDAENVFLYCPHYTRIEDVIDTMSHSQNAVLLLKDGEYYEPLELKQRNKNGVEKISFERGQAMIDVLHACTPVAGTENSRVVAANLIAFDMWASQALMIPSHFKISSFVIGANMRIQYALTKANIIIKIPYGGLPIGYLPRVMKDISVDGIMHHEDIQGNIFNCKFVSVDLQLVAQKLSSIGFGLNAGDVINTATYNGIPIYETALTMPPCVDYPTILTSTHVSREFKEKDRKWHNLQMLVGRTFLSHYETLVQPLESMTRKKRVETLMRTFPKVAKVHSNLLQAVIEEMPLEYGRQAFADWLRRVNYSEKYPFMSTTIKKKDNQWVFSQAAVENGVTYDVVNPAVGPRPRRDIVPLLQNQIETVYTVSPSDISQAGFPDMLLNNYTLDTLPSKWTQIKKYQWSDFKIAKIKDYKRDTLWGVMEWLSEKLMVPIKRDEIKWIKSKKVKQSLPYPDVMSVIMEDASLLKEWNTAFGKKFIDGKQLMQKAYTPLFTKDASKIVSMWKAIVERDELWFSDIDLYAFTTIVPCTIMVLHRSRYGEGNKKRGDITDLGASSTFYAKDYTQKYVSTKPLIILWKEETDDHSVYHPIVDAQGTMLHKSVIVSPKDIRELIEYHIEHKTNRLA